MLNEYNLRAAFSALDEVGVGSVSSEKLSEALSHPNLSSINTVDLQVDRDQWLEMIREIDGRQNGRVSFAEFKSALNSFNCVSLRGSLVGISEPVSSYDGQSSYQEHCSVYSEVRPRAVKTSSALI